MMLSALLGQNQNQPDPNDAFARSHGFHDAATMLAYGQKRQQMMVNPSNTNNGGPSASSGSFIDRLFALHPMGLLASILEKFNKDQANKR